MTGRAADLPLDERRSLEAEKQRELGDGLMRRHVADSQYKRQYLAVHLARVLRIAPALSAKLRGE